MRREVYLDNGASPPCHPEAAREARRYFEEFYGNPQSDHEYGYKTKLAIEEARGQVARLIGATPDEIVFTSSGTEANNFALKGVLQSYRKKGNHFIISAIEHRSVLTTAKHLAKEGYDLTIVPVDETGMVNPLDVADAIKDTTVLVSVMHANNEVGTIQPIGEIGRICKERGVLFHTDAGASTGFVPIDVDALKVDLLSISGYQFYGPKGAGALYIRKGVKITPLIHGGVQERGRRTGMENVPGIVGMGIAAEIAGKEMEDRSTRFATLRNLLREGLVERIPHIWLNGHRDQRLPYHLNVSIEGIEGEALLMSLADEAIFTSSASTCTMMTLESSHVLAAMGVPGWVANGTLMFAFGFQNTEEDVDRVLEALPAIVERLRAMSAVVAGTNPVGEGPAVCVDGGK